MKKIVGKVSKRDHVSCIDDEIYYTLQEVEGNRELPENNLVSCTAVESTQHCGNVAFQWRAVEVSLSKIMAHTQDSHKYVNYLLRSILAYGPQVLICS